MLQVRSFLHVFRQEHVLSSFYLFSSLLPTSGTSYFRWKRYLLISGHYSITGGSLANITLLSTHPEPRTAYVKSRKGRCYDTRISPSLCEASTNCNSRVAQSFTLSHPRKVSGLAQLGGKSRAACGVKVMNKLDKR